MLLFPECEKKPNTAYTVWGFFKIYSTSPHINNVLCNTKKLKVQQQNYQGSLSVTVSGPGVKVPATRLPGNVKEPSRHSSKISSSLSFTFLASLVTVRGTPPCAACCFILEDEMTLWDLVSGRQSDVLLEQAASKAVTLSTKNRNKKRCHDMPYYFDSTQGKYSNHLKCIQTNYWAWERLI